jgi:pilus assembly protein CpaB
MDRKTLIPLIVAVTCGSLAFLLLYRSATSIERGSHMTQALVATVFLPAHSAVQAGQFEKKPIPERYLNPGVMTDASELEGLLTLAPISAGEQLSSNKFTRPGGGLAHGLEPGRRAYCLDVTESAGLGGRLRPGQRVDVIARTDGASRRMTAFALQNIRVLAVGRSTTGEEEEWGSYNHVTLSLSPGECELMAFLEDQSALKLVLRAPGDETHVQLPPMTESDVLSRLGRTQSSARPIEIIRGGTASLQGE